MENKKLPKGWKWESFGEICLITNGTTSEQLKIKTEFPVTRIETISYGIINKNKVGYVNLNENQQEQYRLNVGDILFSHINSFERIGNIAIVTENDLPIYHGMNLLRFQVNKDIILPEYLFYFLKTNSAKSHYEEFAQRAINQASLNQNNLKKLQVLIPPIETQKQIASKIQSKFSEVEKMKDAAERQLEAIKSLPNAILKEMFEF